jgi:hypothetical protein
MLRGNPQRCFHKDFRPAGAWIGGVNRRPPGFGPWSLRPMFKPLKEAARCRKALLGGSEHSPISFRVGPHLDEMGPAGGDGLQGYLQRVLPGRSVGYRRGKSSNVLSHEARPLAFFVGAASASCAISSQCAAIFNHRPLSVWLRDRSACSRHSSAFLRNASAAASPIIFPPSVDFLKLRSRAR